MKKTFPIAYMYQRSLELEAAQRGGWLFGSAQATAALDHMRFSFGFRECFGSAREKTTGLAEIGKLLGRLRYM